MEIWMIVVCFSIFFVTFLIGMPIWLSLTLTAISFALFAGMPVDNVPIKFYSSLDSYLLLAVPFFLLGGNIMARCGPAKALFEAMDAAVGHLPGGLPFAVVCTCMVFAAITGSTLATLVSVGTIAVPPMVAMGYPKRFCLGLMCVSSTLGQIIPPSVYMILYGSYVQVSAAKLFLGGMLPGLFVGLLIAAVVLIKTVNGGYEKQREPMPTAERWRKFAFGLPAAFMPILVLGGIYTGIFTPTEAAAIACVYSIAVSYFIYRGLTWAKFVEALRGGVTTTSMIFLIVAASILLAGPLTYAEIPQNLTNALIDMGVGKYSMIFLSIGLFLFLGLFLDPLPILYLTIPILNFPLRAFNIDMIHFCVITIICMQIAQVTPPFGVSLYTTSQMWDEPIQNVVKSAMPFLLAIACALPIIVFFPSLSTWLPSLFM